MEETKKERLYKTIEWLENNIESHIEGIQYAKYCIQECKEGLKSLIEEESEQSS